jgi:hypothetical protein
MILTYPSNAELMQIQQTLLPTLTTDDLAFQLLPVQNRDAAQVIWEQRDNFTGLQQIRGIDAEPPSTPQTGWKRYRAEPGVYGEWTKVPESAIIERRTIGTFNVPISIDDLVIEQQDFLLNRRVDRWRWTIWTLLSTGVFSATDAKGSVLHYGAYSFKTVTTAIPWSTVATATPLADLLALFPQFRGISGQFGAGSYLIMNRVTANYLLLNNNPNDLGKARLQYGQTPYALDFVNTILVANGLPPVRIYDLGYYPDPPGSAFVPFIPDGKVIVVAQRPNGETLGEFQLTRNASNPSGAPGPYTYVSDSLDGPRPIPRTIRLDDGFNGGPAMFFPSLIFILTAF